MRVSPFLIILEFFPLPRSVRRRHPHLHEHDVNVAVCAGRERGGEEVWGQVCGLAGNEVRETPTHAIVLHTLPFTVHLAAQRYTVVYKMSVDRITLHPSSLFVLVCVFSGVSEREKSKICSGIYLCILCSQARAQPSSHKYRLASMCMLN